MSCSMCKDPPDFDLNPIIECKTCKLQVHKLCYGIRKCKNFLCSPCLENVNANEISCALCGKNGGAVKKTTNDKWVHVICTLFIEGTLFVDNQKMEPVDITNVPKSKYNKKCVFCNEKYGASLKCSKQSCSVYLHAFCGHINNTLKESIVDDDENLNFHGFCKEHSAANKKVKRLSSEKINRLVIARNKKEHKKRADKSNANWIVNKLLDDEPKEGRLLLRF